MKGMAIHGFKFACCLVLFSALTADSSAGGKKVYKSPEEVFEAAKKGLEKEDIKAVLGCLTAESRDETTGTCIAVAGFVKGFAKAVEADKATRERIEKLDQVLAKHGLTEEMLQRKDDQPKIDLSDLSKSKAELVKLAKLVKDRDGFVIDFVTALKTSDKKSGPFEDIVGSNPMLKDVKIDGDAAKGTLVGTQGDMEVRRTLNFKREGGSWKMEMPHPEPKKKK